MLTGVPTRDAEMFSCRLVDQADAILRVDDDDALAQILGGPDSASFCTLFDRVLRDGNWGAAAAAAAVRPALQQPWVVLVTGVNGARKTSSVYQPWFKQALAQALARQHPDLSVEELPDGV